MMSDKPCLTPSCGIPAILGIFNTGTPEQLSMQFDADGHFVPWPEDGEHVHVLSYDEKPGIQAIATTAPDLLPKPGNGTVLRDYEYRRLGTLSLLAGIDLQTGEAIPLIRESHNSADYIDFLKILDAKYPKGDNPTTQEKTLHMDITRWSTPKSD